jgi:predicted amidohydrolase YtcJ
MNNPEQATLLICGARVHTFADAAADRGAHIGNDAGDTAGNGVADAVLVAGERIMAVGNRGLLRERAPRARLLDLGAAVITPGLTDAHMHLTEWALARRTIDLSGTDSPETAAQAVADHAGTLGGDWVLGRGWSAERWHVLPERSMLDRLLPDRPVLLQSHDMHAAWVNTAALERAGMTARSPDPEGGRIVRDELGEPSGLLLETAAAAIAAQVPAAGAAEINGALLAAQAELHRLGITGVHNLPAIHRPDPDPLGVWQQLLHDGSLQLRILQHLPLGLLDDAIRLGLRSGFGNDWIRVGGIKMFLDGALGSRTAWMLEPYETSPDTGIQVMDEEEFRDLVRRAAAAGLASTVHAIGDAAVSLALDVLVTAPLPNTCMRHRIEHLQLCPPDRLASPAGAGITCSMQPSHLITDWQAAERHWGHQRCRGMYAFGSLARHGALLAFGSDAPVEPPDPRLTLYAATTRQDLAEQPQAGWFPEERITMDQALRAMTVGPAVAAGHAAQRGRLSPGADADLVAWDHDPHELTGRELLDLRCVATIVAGHPVWSAVG